MNTIVNVRQMGLRDRGVIRAVSARGELGRRIRDMGLVPGTEISVVGRAPLRDPVALRLRDYTLTLRNSEADYISVELFPAEHPGRRGARHGGPGESSQGCGGCRHQAQNPSSSCRTLDELKEGEKSVVSGLAQSHCRHTGRLMAMGFIPGTEVRVLSGTQDILVVQLHSSRLCLCRSMAQSVLVDGDASCPQTASVLPE